eukprot:5081277-Pyramimonas_sp.AAC.2
MPRRSISFYPQQARHASSPASVHSVLLGNTFAGTTATTDDGVGYRQRCAEPDQLAKPRRSRSPTARPWSSLG